MNYAVKYDSAVDWDEETTYAVQLSAREWDTVLTTLSQPSRSHSDGDPYAIAGLIFADLPESITYRKD